MKTRHIAVVLLSLISGLCVSCVHVSSRSALAWKVIDIQPHQYYTVLHRMEGDCWRVDIEVTNQTTQEVYVDWHKDETAFQADGRWGSLGISALLPYLGPSESRTFPLYLPQQAEAFRVLMYYKSSFSVYYKKLLIEGKVPRSQRMRGSETPPAPAVGVTFLYLTNEVASTNVEGVFLITNKLNTYVYIWRSEIQDATQSDWALLIRRFHAPGMIDPHEQFLFQTWVPNRGGLYRLELHTTVRPCGNQSRIDHSLHPYV
jgi:hypothetical protein